MNLRRVVVPAGFLAVVSIAMIWNGKRVIGDEWLPISQEELKMSSEPKAPGAPAIILYHQVDRDDSNPKIPHEYNYVREKIFTEEGRKYADVDIPVIKDQWNVINIRARTIRPDGSTVDFDGKVYEKEIEKTKGYKYLAKTFTLSDVQPGSIIEYHYMIDFAENYVFNSYWVLSNDLFVKTGKYTLKPYTQWALKWTWPNGLPEGTKPPVNEKIISMEAHDIPAFEVEEDMPPEDAMKYRVDFIYSEETFESDPDKFWKKQGKKWFDAEEGFVNKRRAMEEAVGQIVAPGDSPEVKLQKIYARVQQFRNTSYEVQKTEQEQKRAKEKEVSNVEDIWKKGYGNGYQLTWMFLGLARAAGLDASGVMAATRNNHFFKKNVMRAQDLNTNMVLVKLNGKELYFDPGAAYTPYGFLPWPETGTVGLKLDKDGGTWVTTSAPESSASKIVRKADLNLTSEGTLEGKLVITFTGLEAQSRRLEERNQDDAEKKRFLEDYVKEIIPAGCEVELTNKPEWKSSSPELVAEYTLKVPGWVSGAGKRALMPVGLFSGPEKHIFEHTTRTHPIYFRYQYEKEDNVKIELPLGWQVGSLPQPQNTDAKIIAYSMKAEKDKDALHLERHFRSDLMFLEPKYYTALRNFFQSVRTGDDTQVVLQP